MSLASCRVGAETLRVESRARRRLKEGQRIASPLVGSLDPPRLRNRTAPYSAVEAARVS